MRTTLISSDPSFQVRTARTNKACWGRGMWWRSGLCTGSIRKGSVYVAKVERRIVMGDWRWDGDLRKYCHHCACKVLKCINIGIVDRENKLLASTADQDNPVQDLGTMVILEDRYVRPKSGSR